MSDGDPPEPGGGVEGTDDGERNDDTSDEPAGAGGVGAKAFTHVDASGDAQMVDVGEKAESKRRAVARGTIRLRPETVAAVRANDVAKGDVLATARVGAVQAVKHTWETIPLCHQIPITNVETAFDVGDAAVSLTVVVETVGKTGCEMEALEGVTTGLNVVWDMVKAAEKDADGGYPATRLEDVRVVEKTVEPIGTAPQASNPPGGDGEP